MGVDGLHFRVSSDRQTTENQFEELLRIAEKDDSARDWCRIRQLLSQCVYAEELSSSSGGSRTIYRVHPAIVEELAAYCVYVEQGRSGKAGASRRPMFEQMKRDAALRKFDRLLVWKVSRLGRDMREVISTVYELTWVLACFQLNRRPDRSTPPWENCYGRSRRGMRKKKTTSGQMRLRRGLYERGPVGRRLVDRGRFSAGMRCQSSDSRAYPGVRSLLSWE